MSIGVPDLLIELRDMTALIAVRKDGGGDQASADAMAKSMVDAFNHKIMKLKQFRPADALNLQKCLNDVTIDESLRNSIETSLGARLSAGTASTEGSRVPNVDASYTFLKCDYYYTEIEWNKLWDRSVPLQTKIELLTQRINALGIRTVNEQLVKRLVAILLIVGFDPNSGFPPYSSIYEMVKDVKNSIASANRPSPYSHSQGSFRSRLWQL